MRKTNTTTNTNKPLKIYVYGGTDKMIFFNNIKYKIIEWGGKTYFKTNAKTYIGECDNGYFIIDEIKTGGAF